MITVSADNKHDYQSNRSYILNRIKNSIIVFVPKYRRKIKFGDLKQDIANILSILCKRKEVHIVEAEICPNDVHVLIEITPKMSVSDFVGYLKGKSTLIILKEYIDPFTGEPVNKRKKK